jgi:putative transposase
MKPSRFAEEQIIGILREWRPVRRRLISVATRNLKRDGGPKVSDAERLKAQENENAKLKRLLTDARQRHAQGRCRKKC